MNIAKVSIVKLDYLASKGFDPRIHNPDFYLQAAIEAEKLAKACGPFDPAFEHYSNRARIAFDAAIMAEDIRHA